MLTEQTIEDTGAPTGEGSGQEQSAGQTGVQDQKMAANPNPRANENINQTPIEKTTGDEEGSATTVGSEITDGEGG